MKKPWIPTLIVCAAVLLAAALITGYGTDRARDSLMKVGFIYSEDESTPYTANFVQAQRALAAEFGEKVQILQRSNVLSRDCEQPLRDLIREGCELLFINLDSDIPITMAREFPGVQFCQVSLPGITLDGTPENYHTFNGEISQARYVSGIAAGMKLRQMLDSGALRAEDALIGFVGANDSPEVVSGYTAFLLGARSVAPEARMRVRYTGSWGNFNTEKEQTRRLIEEGCVIIGQHVNTTASAVACEEAVAAGHTVFHVGYHQSMMDVAPSCALVSIRTNWAPYILEAARAVMEGKIIEETVQGHAHGRDMSAGFENGWVEMLELNRFIAADGTAEKMERAIDGLKRGRIRVFSGNYTGVNPRNPGDVIDLNAGYTEYQNSSNPSFCYLLQGYIETEN